MMSLHFSNLGFKVYFFLHFNFQVLMFDIGVLAIAIVLQRSHIFFVGSLLVSMIISIINYDPYGGIMCAILCSQRSNILLDTKIPL